MASFDHLDPASYPLPESLSRDLMSPALIVYLDHVRSNVAEVLDALGGQADRWRPHVKTTKIPEVWAELVRAGLRHFKCATTREAHQLLAVLDREGVDGDLLVAYPLLGPALGRLGRIAEGHPTCRVSLLCEDPGLLGEIPHNLGVYVDLDPGMNRTGVPLTDVARVEDIARGAGERLRGLHYYDGHLHDDDGDLRRRRVFAGYDELLGLHEHLRGAGLAIGEIVTAGTPAFLSALDYGPLRGIEGTVHRVSPGTVVFHDARSQEQNPGLELTPAALVFTRVISLPAPGRVTCDAGSKSVAADAGDPVAQVLGHPELEALTPSEEHLPLRVTRGDPPARGEPLLLVPRHVCPTVNLAEEAVLVDAGRVVGVVPVAARAHELRARP